MVPRRDTTPETTCIEIRTDLPYREALSAAIVAFEAAYVDALMRRHCSLVNASRASGLQVDELIAIIGRQRDGLDMVRMRAA